VPEQPAAGDVNLLRTVTQSENIENTDRNNTLNTLGIVFGLLQNNKLRKEMKFNEDDLINFLLTVFNDATGKQMTEDDIDQLLDLRETATDANGNVASILPSMGDILNERILELQDETDVEVVRAKMDELVAAFKKVKPSSRSVRKLLGVAGTLIQMQPNLREGRLEATMEAAGLDMPEGDVLLMNTAVEKSVEKSEHPAIAPLTILFEAFQASEQDYDDNYRDYFKSDLLLVIDKIDGAFDLAQGLGNELLTASLGAQDSTALVESIATNYNLEQNSEDLTTKLDEVYSKLKTLFPDLIQKQVTSPIKSVQPVPIQPAPVQGPSVVTPVVDTSAVVDTPVVVNAPEIDYDKFYEDILKEDESRYHAQLLQTLYGIFHVDAAGYDQHYKNSYFDKKKDINTVKTELKTVFGPVLLNDLMIASKTGNYETALIKVIAEQFELDKEGDELNLSRKLKEIHRDIRQIDLSYLHLQDPGTPSRAEHEVITPIHPSNAEVAKMKLAKLRKRISKLLSKI